MPLAYTPTQLTERAHIRVKRTGLYPTAVVECEGFTLVNKTWPEWKDHLVEAYELRGALGITANGVGYHRAANALKNEDTLDESLAQTQVSNNAAMQGF